MKKCHWMSYLKCPSYLHGPTVTSLTCQEVFSSPQSVADPGFSRGGAWTLQGGREHAKFSRKLHEIERIWTPRGGRASLTPPLDPPMPMNSRPLEPGDLQSTWWTGRDWMVHFFEWSKLTTQGTNNLSKHFNFLLAKWKSSSNFWIFTIENWSCWH